MSYAARMVYVNIDHVSKALIGVAAGLTDKFSAKLIGISAHAITPPFVAEGVGSSTMRRNSILHR